MLPLPELQRQFAAAVYEDAPGVLACVSLGQFGATRHMQVYRNNTFVSLTEALVAIYPVTQKLVSDGFFAFAADRYIREYPPRRAHLHVYGAEFPDFLAGFEPARTLPYLPDVARLEWAWHEVFHEADSAPLAADRLAAVPPERYGKLRFRLNPAARVIDSHFPILRIWQANQDDGHDMTQVDLTEGGTRLLVVRPALAVEIEPLDTGDYALLQALAEGVTFSDASNRTLGVDSSYDLAARLGYFVRRAAITDFTLT
jgi:hypothetical protein